VKSRFKKPDLAQGKNDIMNTSIYRQIKNTKVPFLKNELHKKLLLENLKKVELKFQSNVVEKKQGFLEYFFAGKNLKYSLSLSSVLILVFIFAFVLSFFNTNRKIHTAFYLEKGNAFIKSKPVNEIINKNLKNNDIVSTGLDSSLSIKINDSNIILSELTEIKIMDLSKNKHKEITRFKLLKGNIYCSVKLPDKNSGFEVFTDNAKFCFRGTKFSVDITENNDIILKVEEGLVEISNYIDSIKNLRKIKYYPEVFNRLNNLISEKQLIRKGDRAYISDVFLKDFNLRLNNFVSGIFSINSGHLHDKDISEKIAMFEIESAQLINKTANSNTPDINEKVMKKETFEIKKVSRLTGVNLKEISTGLSADKNSIYIASDSDNAVYCIDPAAGEIKWIFKDQNLKNITSNVYSWKNFIIVGSLNKIFILNKSGNVILSKDIEKGVNYWPDFIESDNKIYIPTSHNIYVYDGISINALENFPESIGQLFISTNDSQLFCFDLNSLDITIYDLNEKRIVKRLAKLKARAFMAPIICGKYLYIADINGNIYKYDQSIDNSIPKIIRINAGIADMIKNDGKLYFVADDGWFYQIDLNEFKTVYHLSKVDEHTTIDKNLTKKMMVNGNYIYYSADNGRIFYYNISNSDFKFIDIHENIGHKALIGTPVKIGDSIYFMDLESDLFKLSKKIIQ
jgi:outer membrane protein assembly factor BamB